MAGSSATKINLAEKFAQVDGVWEPRIAAHYNDHEVCLSRAHLGHYEFDQHFTFSPGPKPGDSD